MSVARQTPLGEVLDETERGLGALFQPGDVFELRIPKFKRSTCTVSGYFDDIGTAAKAAAAYCRREARGVYVTMNPVPRALLSRSPNVMTEYAENTTQDKDIERRRWVLFDFDADRPAGISASDDEKTASVEAAEVIRAWLCGEHGWPEPVVGDSGNGTHMLFRVDLPGDDGGTVERVLKAAAAELAGRHLPGPPVKVDTSVANASRITKVFGTVARKGHDTPERPHRRSRLLSVPEVIAPVPEEKLAAVAALVPQPVAASNGQAAGTVNGNGQFASRLDVPAWLRARGVGFTLKEKTDGKGRTVHVLDRCPFNADHGRDSAILQSPDGTLHFKCLHDGCSGRKYADVRDAIGKPDPEHWNPPLRKKRERPAAKPPAEVEGDPAAALVREEGRTDLANAKRLRRLFGEKLRYCHKWGCWLVWDGRRWKIDDDGSVGRYAHKVVDDIWHEARGYAHDRAREPLQWAAVSASRGKIDAMLRLAQDLLPITPDELNKDPWKLNTPSGTVDLRTGEAADADPSDYITTITRAPFDPEAGSWHWDRFLDAAFCDRVELMDFVRRLVGYCLTGLVIEQVLPIATGSGGNGKSTLIEAIFDALGPDYAGSAAPELLLDRKQKGHPTELADLYGKRLVVCSETGAGRWLDEELVKRLTGSDTIKARRMREDFWEFRPTHKLLVVTNHLPNVRHLDDAMTRRLRVIPFDARFEGASRDRSMPAKLRKESAGILAWAVRGCLEWRALKGLGTCDAVTVATAGYFGAQDVLGRFIDEACVRDPEAKVRGSAFHEALDRWCKDLGHSTPSTRRTGEYLRQRYPAKTSNGVWYQGLGLRA